MNDPRGSLWRKWDLHVHTPESLVHEYDGADPWPQFIDELEHLPAEFKVIGINDYIFLDGYRRILKEKAAGHFKNIDLFLPVIELRLDKFGGSQNHLKRVNYHIIFSDELGADLIEHQFLNALPSKYILSPQYDDLQKKGKWQALPTKQSLADLGQQIIDSVPANEKKNYKTPLVEGFNNLCLSLDSLSEALSSPYFKDKYVTAVGKTEWASINWNDNTIADKKTIINGARLVFTASDSRQHWENAKKSLTDSGVNDCLVDCSDAHHFASSDHKDRLGNCLTWMKADTTFEGLLQVLIEPVERIYVGDLPPEIAKVRANPTKYIRDLQIRRKTGTTFSEKWFDNTIPLNDGMVAIIGNKGKGKSAFTDILGLLCNTKQNRDFTFLSPDNFRQTKDNKAKHFEAVITFESGNTITKGLEAAVDEKQPELIKYIPQNFLEKICTQLGKIEETDFDRELKKVIFSHVDIPYRLGKVSLDDLISYKTSEANEKSDLLKAELHRINEEATSLETKMEPEYREKIQNLLNVKLEELKAHNSASPAAVVKPENDPVRQKQISEAATAIDAAKLELQTIEKDTENTSQNQSTVLQLITASQRLAARIDNIDRQVQAFFADSADDMTRLGITRKDVLTIAVHRSTLEAKQISLATEKQEIDKQLDPKLPTSLPSKAVEVEKRIEKLQSDLDEPNRRYQAYQAALKQWELQGQKIQGAESSPGTIKYYEAQLKALDEIPDLLQETRSRRMAKAKEIHAVIRELAETYRELYAPVNTFIESSPLAKDKFQLNFEVGIVDTGFADKFFEIVSYGPAGSFCGIEPGSKALRAILARQDFNSAAGIEAFLSELMTALQTDQRAGGKPVRIADQLRTKKFVLDLYDLMFSLDYIRPRYALRMGNKELAQLSPGERGTLLLVFYLLVDKDDIPLVIDQPEENLDNQTVYELLVPCMKEAKRRRQVFIVTHNPNLAVVCDAEQVVCANLDKKNNWTMEYLSGAIENPTINKAIVDILEGTMPAFHNRQTKYTPHSE
jgi:ABC-type lipoprotein export system ATPase subunit